MKINFRNFRLLIKVLREEASKYKIFLRWKVCAKSATVFMIAIYAINFISEKFYPIWIIPVGTLFFSVLGAVLSWNEKSIYGMLVKWLDEKWVAAGEKFRELQIALEEDRKRREEED